MGADAAQGVSQLGTQDQPVDVAVPAGGCVLVGRDGRQRGSADPGLDHVDRGVGGDDEEPGHQRPARGVERRAGPPGPQEGFLDHVLGEIGVDDDPAGARQQADVIRGVRGGHARLGAEPSASLGFHEPSLAPGPRPPHR